MALTSRQRQALNLFSRRQPELVPFSQSGDVTTPLLFGENVLLGDLFDASAPATTTGDITISVDSAGLDSRDDRPIALSSGDWSAMPFLTIQTALDSLPKIVKHRIIVNIGAGSFAGFTLDGFMSSSVFDRTTRVPKRGSIIIRGATPSLSTLASGVNTGLASAGLAGINSNSITSQSLVKAVADATWTANDLQFRWLRIIAGPGSDGTIETSLAAADQGFADQTVLIPIVANGTTYVNALGIPAAPTSATQYQICDLTTTINAPAATYYDVKEIVTTPPAVLVQSNNCDITFYGIKFNYTSGPQVVVSNCKGHVRMNACEFRGSTTQRGYIGFECDEPILNWCQFVGNQGWSFLYCTNIQLSYDILQSNTAASAFQDCEQTNLVNIFGNTPGAGFLSWFRVVGGFIGGNTSFLGGTGNGYAVSHTMRLYFSTAQGSGISGYGFSISGFTNVRIQTSGAGVTGDILMDSVQALTHTQRSANLRTRYNFVCIDAT